MGFKLREGISFCEASDRLLFLDVVADRYFCLQPRAEQAFRTLLLDQALDPSHPAGLLGMLEAGTLLETAGQGVPHAFRLHPQASLSLLDTAGKRTRTTHLASALAAILKARLSLRWCRLHNILRGVDLGHISWPRTGTVDLDALQDAATAFEGTSRILRSHDQCLSRSIALARYLSSHGLPADLVIGVKLRPFAAHAWVQSGRWLVNDRIDTVRAFTPIVAF